MVHVVEGEKDVLAVESVGGVAVCTAMGAGKAARFDWEPLRSRDILVVADRDKPVRKHAAEVVELVRDIAASVSVVVSASGYRVSWVRVTPFHFTSEGTYRFTKSPSTSLK